MNYSTYSDFELLRAIRQNDQKAFGELFNRYWKNAYAIVFARVRSEEVTKEIVQDLFISLWNKRATLTIDHLPSYLYAASKNRVINYVASQTVLKKHWDYYKTFIVKDSNVSQNDVDLNELKEALEDGIELLPEKSKKIFRLNRLDGRSITEIANLLNLSEKAIQYHITQSIKKLRLHLKDYILIAVVVACF